MKLDNLAVVFIGTDKYLKFLPSWYQTCEEKLVPNIPKQYFVFTDGQLEGTPENVSLYKQEHLPWPFITLLRFSTILKAKEELSKYDWLLFLDAASATRVLVALASVSSRARRDSGRIFCPELSIISTK